MEIRNLNTFLHAASLQNITRAAAELGYSQSAVTMQIKQLEAELQAQLFERIGKRAKLTQAGERLLPLALNILDSARKAEDIAREPEQISGKLRIGTCESYVISVLPPVFMELGERCPGVEISTGPGGRTHLLAYGASGRNAPLAAFLAGVSAERRMRAGRILDRLAEAGLTVTPKMRALPDIPSVGRAHFARALVESGKARDVHQAFDRYLSEGRPGYVPRASLPTGDTVAALSGMGLVVVLAHPMRLELERETLYALIREWKARGLRGVEAYHPSAGRRGARLLDALAREEGLLVTGGSDYHGDAGTRARMGRLPCGWRTSERDIAALMAAVDLAAPIDHLQKEQQDV